MKQKKKVKMPVLFIECSFKAFLSFCQSCISQKKDSNVISESVFKYL